MRSALVVAWTVIGVAALSGAAVAQSQPTPGLPSQPFGAAAQAQNGGAGPQVTYQYGMEFVTVQGGTNNYPGGGPQDVPGISFAIGRGAVDHDYRISRYEVGASSWSAFYAAADAVAAQTGQQLPFITRGGNLSGSGQYGRVGNISWRTAAMYCNWLCNGQAVTRDAFMNGAYDVSTFGFGNGGETDQLVHNPGAQFWIPTLDEWVRAAHYDPNRNGPGQDGWWQFSISRDTNAIPGLPRWGGEANAGFSTPNLEEFTVPLGAYANVQSPWGLFDTIGQTTEWLEEPFYAFAGQLPTGRLQAGAYITGPGADIVWGTIGASIGQSDPLDDAYWMGFRIAAAVPSPAPATLLAVCATSASRRRRRA
ncbi:MAG: SUMF1/EgtB/PvdO family nonheme iron enzyme [Phycisphaerales bacterium]